ncbi:MAG: hypothetical protein A2314_03790 [Elusimicrobia bacterium RIFOXYB2_FULL_50_12]|nr:MAG: hypothetical protein A2314_03790 [Elusimicrobia bacterium RIFOXYB2_FULL_50_12]
MFIMYDNKRPEKEILTDCHRATLKILSGNGARNKLIHGDNSGVMKMLLDTYAGKINLVYIDPPFATNGHFKIGEERRNGTDCRHRKGATGEAIRLFWRNGTRKAL